MDLISLARELQAMSQNGLHFAKDHYDQERYRRLGELAAEMLSSQSQVPVSRIVEWNSREFGYATPKIDVRGLVVQDGRVLLVRENADGGRWTLPGGWADVGETPSSAVTREVWEETGYQCQAVSLLAVLDREKQGHQPPFPYHVYKMFFHCQIVGGTASSNLESSGSAFFDPETLPDLSVSRVQTGQIQRLVRKVICNDRSCDFD